MPCVNYLSNKGTLNVLLGRSNPVRLPSGPPRIGHVGPVHDLLAFRLAHPAAVCPLVCHVQVVVQVILGTVGQSPLSRRFPRFDLAG
jgi:hypothetical protein